MRSLFTVLFICLITSAPFSQPSTATVQADLKKEFGASCQSVTVVGNGSTSTDYINGGYSSFYRVPVNIKLKTDLAGVTKLLKGAAKYSYAGGSKYSYSEYAPGTSEYIGLPPPDTAAIRTLILSMPDYGLYGAGNVIDVIGFSFSSSPPPVWPSLESVMITAEMIYTQRGRNNTLETIKHPYTLQVYRQAATAPWNKVAWTTPDYRADPRAKAVIKTEQVGSYALSKMTNLVQKAQMKAAEAQAASGPKVQIPAMASITDIMKWYHGLLMEGDYAKVEAVTVQLLSPDNFDRNTKLLNGIGQSKMNSLKKALTNDFSTYNKQYCDNPQLNGQNATSVYWWNKDKSKSSGFKIEMENGRWYFTEVGIYTWDYTSESRAGSTMAAPCK